MRALLTGARFTIDYYQREYRWKTKQVAEFVEDLAEKFKDNYQPGDPRTAVMDYDHYFLGSIIISDQDGRNSIIDGQQRLTTLTLLLIHIYLLLEDAHEREQLTGLVFSTRFGQRSFNLDVEERAACMEALFAARPFEEADQPESVVNILRRFRDVGELFPAELADTALPYFKDRVNFCSERG